MLRAGQGIIGPVARQYRNGKFSAPQNGQFHSQFSEKYFQKMIMEVGES